LFGGAAGEPERIPLPDADLVYFANALSVDAAACFRDLRTNTHWREEKVFVWGRSCVQPRLVAWHGDPGTDYGYSGIHLRPSPWTPTLTRLRDEVEKLAGAKFNSVLLNLYRNERDCMGWHSDDEPELGPEPIIASISFGETREFRLRHRSRKELPVVRMPLTDGSVLIMAGPTQRNWQHSVKRGTVERGERINLTFRSIKSEES
jgi:alkylated DNA repair dioxygenase AlkB